MARPKGNDLTVGQVAGTDKSRQAVSEAVIRTFAQERIRQGLSKNKLSELAGLSLTMVSYVERGMRNSTLDTLLRIAEALRVDLGQIIKDASNAAAARS